jgi:hypothetical protein
VGIAPLSAESWEPLSFADINKERLMAVCLTILYGKSLRNATMCNVKSFLLPVESTDGRDSLVAPP